MGVHVRIIDDEAIIGSTTREAALFQDLVRRSSNISIERSPDAQTSPGQKGAEIEVGAFVMGLVTSGAVTALIQVLSHYLSKTRKTEVSFEAPTGEKMSVRAENLEPDQVEETTRRLKAVFDST